MKRNMRFNEKFTEKKQKKTITRVEILFENDDEVENVVRSELTRVFWIDSQIRIFYSNGQIPIINRSNNWVSLSFKWYPVGEYFRKEELIFKSNNIIVLDIIEGICNEVVDNLFYNNELNINK